MALPRAKLGVSLFRHPCRKPLSPGERLCMLGWLCIVQSPCAYTPGIRAGAILLGLPPLVQARMLAVSHTKPLHDAVAQMADDLYGGYAPATPFLSTIEVFRQSEPCIALMHGFYVIGCSFQRSAYPLRSFRHAVLQAIRSYCSRLLRPCREFLRFRC